MEALKLEYEPLSRVLVRPFYSGNRRELLSIELEIDGPLADFPALDDETGLKALATLFRVAPVNLPILQKAHVMAVFSNQITADPATLAPSVAYWLSSIGLARRMEVLPLRAAAYAEIHEESIISRRKVTGEPAFNQGSTTLIIQPFEKVHGLLVQMISRLWRVSTGEVELVG